MTVSKTATALWITEAGRAKLCETPYTAGQEDIEISTLYSAISRGTERLIFNGRVPQSEHDTMRAPFQEGAFSFPIKYGYSTVGQIGNGPRKGEHVFALFPHQDRFSLPADALITVPDAVPAKRAILAANMETALNINWDAQIGPGDRVAVIGCGVVGALTAYIADRTLGTEVVVIDVDPSRAQLAQKLGLTFGGADHCAPDYDVVINTSASAAGLETAINLAGIESKIIEASWFGTGTTQVSLGGAFHQRRLSIAASQVGRIPAQKAARWTYRRRLTLAMSFLSDPALDVLISGESGFATLAQDYGSILEDPETLCHRIRYDTSV